MKKTKFFMPLIAALALSSCSSEDEPKNVSEEVDATSSYFSFSICNVNAATSSPAGVKSRADYEDGKGDEATIANVVLFFYDNDGNAINVNVGSTNTNYVIIRNPGLSEHTEQIGETGDYNVEKWFETVQEINVTSPIKTAQVLAMVNASIGETEDLVYNSEDKVIAGNASLTQMYSKAVFKGQYQYNSDTKSFVMSSSAYKDADDNIICPVMVDICDTPDDAKKKQAVIYVERIKARVNVIENPEVENNLYTPTIEAANLPEEGVDKTKLQIKLLGWTLNTTAERAFFFKSLVEPADGASWTWNIPGQHRSFWEVTPGSNVYNTSFIPNDITKLPNAADKQYINPNTSSTPTKVLVRTQLLENNKPVSIASWYGNNYLFKDLKKAILEAINSENVYTMKVAAQGDAEMVSAEDYQTLTEDDIVLTQGSGLEVDGTESWLTYISLDKSKNYYFKEQVPGGLSGQVTLFTQYKTVTEAGVAAGINDASGKPILNGAKIWKDGYAYYFVDIKHLNGKAGVVRNHSYTLQIDGFQGLGTPIYDPTIVIPNPEIPEDDKKSYMSVKMNVLSWRIVPVQNVTFGKKE